MIKNTKIQPTEDAQKDSFLLVFLLDRTGSMQACYDATISGFNEFLVGQQKEKSGKAYMSLIKFDAYQNEPMCQVAYTERPIAEVEPLGTEENPYIPRGANSVV